MVGVKNKWPRSQQKIDEIVENEGLLHFKIRMGIGEASEAGARKPWPLPVLLVVCGRSERTLWLVHLKFAETANRCKLGTIHNNSIPGISRRGIDLTQPQFCWGSDWVCVVSAEGRTWPSVDRCWF